MAADHAQAAARVRADYGLDAPTLVLGFFLGGLAGVIASLALLFWGAPLSPAGLVAALVAALGYIVLLNGSWFLLTSALMLWSSRRGKLIARDRLLDRLRLRGDETVLDIGCGHGLLLIGAAKRLPHGRAIGVDVWSQVDQGRNSKSATLANAAAEGVADRVAVLDGDMRALPLAAASVDVAVASLAIHNIKERGGRRRAIGEIVRVLRPGGKVAILDIARTAEYAAALRAAGLRDVRRSRLIFWIYPPVRTVTATMPPTGVDSGG
jgi:arsenite methyltransferase